MQRIDLSRDQLVINPTINPRHASDDDVKDLVAVIIAEGFTDALWVRKQPGQHDFYEVIDGQRRKRALDLLEWEDGIPCDLFEVDDLAARKMALAANVVRSDLSPADEAVAFHQLAKGGMAVKDIAAHYAAPERRVRQRIAIGSLPQPIIDALRADRIELECAQAFTLTTSSERQMEVFGDGRNLSGWGVRRALTEDQIPDTDYRFNFVGHESYVAAGGLVNEDLFGKTSYITDAALLQRLFDEKVESTTRELKDKGWKWVKLLVGNDAYNHKFERQPARGKSDQSEEQKQLLATRVSELKVLQAEEEEIDNAIGDGELTEEQEARWTELEDLIAHAHVVIEALQVKPYTQKQMANLGVLLLAHNNTVDFEYGMQAPADKKAAAKDRTPDPDEDVEPVTPAQAGAVKAETAGYSDAMEMALLAVARDCTRLALVSKPAMAYRLGLAARVAGFLDGVRPFDVEGDLYPPFTVPHYHSEDEGKMHVAQQLASAVFEGCATFMDVAARLETLTPETILQIEAVLAASLLQATALKNTDAQALINHADPDMRATGFVAGEEFFKGISRKQLLLISAEIDENNIIKETKKPDMVTALLPLVEASGWLPPQLRTPSYEGPGSTAYSSPAEAGEAPQSQAIARDEGESAVDQPEQQAA